MACALCNRLCQLTILNSFLLQSSHTHVAQHARFHTFSAGICSHTCDPGLLRNYVCAWIKADSFCPYCFGIRFLFHMMGIKEDPGSRVCVCVHVVGGWKLPNFVLWSSGWNIFHHVLIPLGTRWVALHGAAEKSILFPHLTDQVSSFLFIYLYLPVFILLQGNLTAQ